MCEFVPPMMLVLLNIKGALKVSDILPCKFTELSKFPTPDPDIGSAIDSFATCCILTLTVSLSDWPRGNSLTPLGFDSTIFCSVILALN